MNPSETLYVLFAVGIFAVPFSLDMWYTFKCGRIYKYEIASVTRRLVKLLHSHGMSALWVIPAILGIYAIIMTYMYVISNGNLMYTFTLLFIGAFEHAVLGFGWAHWQIRRAKKNGYSDPEYGI